MAWSQTDPAATQEKTSPEGNRLLNEGVAAYRQGRTLEASQLWNQAFEVYRRELGEDHPYTLIAMNNLATAYNSLRQPDKAKPLNEQTLKLRRAKLGVNHPDTLASMNNLADTYRALGQYEEALAIGQQAVTLMQATLGETNTNTLIAMTNLAATFSSLGQHEKALPLQEQILKIRRAKLGENHPSTRAAMNSLAATRDALSQQENASPPKDETPAPQVAKVDQPRADAPAPANPAPQAKADPAPQDKKAAPPKDEVPAPSIAKMGQPLAVAPAPASLAPQAKTDLVPQVQKAAPPKDEVPVPPVAKVDQPRAVAPAPASLAPQAKTDLVPQVQKAAPPKDEVPVPPVARVDQPRVAAPAPATLAPQAKTDPVPQVKKASPSKDEASAPQVARIDQPRAAAPAPASLTPQAKTDPIPQVKAPAPKDDAPLQKSTKPGVTAANTLLALSNQAAAFSTLGQHDKALALIPDAVADLEKLRATHADKRQSPLADYADRYRQYAKSYASAGRFEEAFNLGDTAKTHALVDNLNAPAGLSLQPATAKEAKRLIGAGEVFVSYLLDKSGMAQAFVLDASGDAKWVDLGRITNHAKTVAAYLKLVSPGAEDDAESQLVKLKDGGYEWLPSPQPLPEGASKVAEPLKTLNRYWHDTLIKPVLPLAGAKTRWILSPDKDLALLPFDVLAESFDAAGNPAQTLVQTRKISLVQSFALLAQIKQREGEYAALVRPKELLAMGHAVYGEGWANQRGVRRGSSRWYEKIGAGQGSGNALASVQAAAEQAAMRRLTWRNLPGTGYEVQTVGKLFDGTTEKSQARADILTGMDASEAKLRQLDKEGKLKDYRYLLFSVHGYVGENPELSGIVLSQQGNPPEIDGYVSAVKWSGLAMKSDLAVLSAYDTRADRTQAGESAMELPYALFVAGNRNTLLSLWPVDDDATAEFMRRFFSKLAAGMSQADALQQTKNEFKQHFLWNDAKFWAAFVLYGA